MIIVLVKQRKMKKRQNKTLTLAMRMYLKVRASITFIFMIIGTLIWLASWICNEIIDLICLPQFMSGIQYLKCSKQAGPVQVKMRLMCNILSLIVSYSRKFINIMMIIPINETLFDNHICLISSLASSRSSIHGIGNNFNHCGSRLRHCYIFPNRFGV